MIWIIILIAVVVIALVALALRPMRKKNRITRGLSVPARRLYDEYMELDVENRPFDNIVPLLRALDEKTAPQAEKRDNHFFVATRSGFEWSWTGSYRRCYHDDERCALTEYKNLHDTIDEVKEAVEEKNYVLQMAKAKPDLDMLNELMNSLRSEANIQREVADHFKEL